MSLPPPRDLSHHLSYTAKNRQPSSVKQFYKYFQIPGIGNLAGGLPHFSYFPYDTLESAVAHPHRFQPTPNSPPSENADGDEDAVLVATGRPSASTRITVPKESETASPRRRIDILTALQYGTVEGYPPLLSFVRNFTRKYLHPSVPYAGGPEVILSCGSTDGFSKTIETFTNVWNHERDWVGEREGVLCEEFTYMNAIQTIKPRGLNIVSVAMDAQGMLAFGNGGLADVLYNWDFRKGRRPHLMYTVTTGQNPTGGSLSRERKMQIYGLCQKYDIIIVEDDPYWNLQYPSACALEARHRGTISRGANVYQCNDNTPKKSSGYDFLDSLLPSYLAMDMDGRVVRLDTFSKTIAPGCRLGWVTAQPAIIERLARVTETSTQQPSGFVQSLVAELLLGQETTLEGDDQGWKMDGWVRWLAGLRGGYERRMQTMCNVLEEGKYLIGDNLEASNSSISSAGSWEVVDKVQVYDFAWPTGGMFVWIKINFDTHPLWARFRPEKLSRALWVHLTRKPYLCLVAPGQIFSPTPQSSSISWQYIRVCFAPIDAEDVGDVSKRLVEGFHSFWKRKDLDDLGEDVVGALEMLHF